MLTSNATSNNRIHCQSNVSIQDPTSTSSSFSTSCDNHEWKVARCLSNGLSVCVDCPDPCARSHYGITPMALFMNPCSFNEWEPTQHFRFLQIQMTDTHFPSAITDIAIPKKTKTSIQVDVTVAYNESLVYCNKYATNVPQTEITRFSLVQADFMAQYSLTASIEITNLEPSTSYRIYCATQSIKSGRWMEDHQIQQKSALVSTLCCVPVKVILNSHLIYVDEMPSLTFLEVSTDVVADNGIVKLEIMMPSLLSRLIVLFHQRN